MRPQRFVRGTNLIGAADAALAERTATAIADAAFAAFVASHPADWPRDPCLRCGTTGRDHAAHGCRRYVPAF